MSSYPDLFRRFIVQDTRRTADWVEESGALFSTVEREEILNTLSFALDCTEAWCDAHKILMQLEVEYRRAPLPEQWIVLLEKALRKFDDGEDNKAASAFVHLYLGFLYQRCSDTIEAIGHFQLSADIFQILGLSVEQGNALNRLALALRSVRKLDEAEKFASQAISLLGNDERREFSYFVLGTIAYDNEEYSKALVLFKESLELAQKVNDPLLIGQRLRNLGPAYRKLEKYDAAIDCYGKAIAIFEKIQATYEISVTLMNLGNVYSKTNDLEKALLVYGKAESILLHSHERKQQAQLYTNLGMLQRELGSVNLARQALKRAIELWRQIGNHYSLANALDELAILLILEGQKNDARVLLEEACELLSRDQKSSFLYGTVFERLRNLKPSEC